MVNSFRTIEEAITQANRLQYGLAAYAFTQSARVSNRVAAEIESGMVGINSFLISVPESPFGGVKDSGHGSEEGIEGLEACLVTKFVTEA
jgi:succinate-semialdehyde dehydrogenase/glutarate-semialdehyde dehydrogenase